MFGGGSLGGNVLGAGYSQAQAGYSGLGRLFGLSGTVLPGECWDVPGFKDCHRGVWERARATCDPAYGGETGDFGSVSECTDYMADAYAFNDCVPKYCPQKARGTVTVGPIYAKGEPCAATNTVKFVQFVIGAGVDGKWGPSSQAKLEKSGKRYTEVAPGCTGDCPAKLNEPWCSGKTVSACPPGETLIGGRCVVPTSPTCGTIGRPCPCCEGLECKDGLCRQPGGNVGPVKTQKMSMMWIGLAGLLALGAGAYVMSKKKKLHSNTRRAPRVGRGRIYRYA